MFKFKGNGIIWDSGTNKIIARFKNGEFETDDPAIATLLKEKGYQEDGDGMALSEYSRMQAIKADKKAKQVNEVIVQKPLIEEKEEVIAEPKEIIEEPTEEKKIIGKSRGNSKKG